ncbi:hypothetical protein GGD63_006393 [Bradyrhizobium sp. cir1]|uniref:hypothetical protein n=1 Tax=Bradyrhizobium sp. cir1 TaxID=1445730 RepID=UPI001606D1D9|nr:hypothetical protein [Bradyrhizobium sp. cir1]MBB4373570.1 hypothetical protein [Bradyrhizobium sp. cir1]
MTRAIVVVREVGKLNPEYSLEFDLPEVPRVGSYISINRPDNPEPYSEDMIVEKVWWRLHHPETRAGFSASEPAKIGKLTEISRLRGHGPAIDGETCWTLGENEGQKSRNSTVARVQVRQDAFKGK